MKDSIIKLLDTLVALGVIVCVLVGAAMGATHGQVWLIVGALLGFVAGALVSGTWFVFSGIYEQTKETNRHLRELRISTGNVQAELEAIKKHIIGPMAN